MEIFVSFSLYLPCHLHYPFFWFYILVKNIWKRRFLSVTSRCYLLVLLSQNVYCGAYYIKHYFGRLDKFYRFASYLLSLWSLMVAIQLVCLITSLRRWFFNAYYVNVGNQWWTVLTEEAIARRFCPFNFSAFRPPKLVSLMFFCIFPMICNVLDVTHFHFYLQNFDPHPPLYKYVLFSSSIANIWYFSLFCYFIHLQLITLQVHFDSVIWFVKNHLGKLDLCQLKLNSCFNEYLWVRRLVHPWITFVICATAFGIAVHLACSYNIMFPNEESSLTTFAPTMPLANITEAQNVDFYLLSALIFVEKLGVLFLALFAVGGSDISYVWKRCCLTLNIMYTSRQDKFWLHFAKLIRNLNKMTSEDGKITDLLLPLLLIAIGILGIEQFGF
ncbi:hypothetical protein HOLleu_40880 [Holothuria leucospilota]|uniref:Uncharacterized protein n=1 Tax=Holothuria leucospilota TaxID=206669 RepID=A0A9Q0YLL4_HOLLE|nr:hypothetical protein HOLleu_40880 [Holothuria leucospilota]